MAIISKLRKAEVCGEWRHLKGSKRSACLGEVTSDASMLVPTRGVASRLSWSIPLFDWLHLNLMQEKRRYLCSVRFRSCWELSRNRVRILSDVLPFRELTLLA
jgi:hypothetical protein